MRNFKKMPEMAGAAPVTGLGLAQPRNLIRLGGNAATLGAVTYNDSGEPTTHSTQGQGVVKAGRT